jgi:WD40 repeat protein/serine/threonine protein kinase
MGWFDWFRWSRPGLGARELGLTALRSEGPAEPSDDEPDYPARPLIFEPGELVADTYRIRHRIGGGGMGTVYLAEHLRWNLDIVLKAPNAEVLADAVHRRRLRTEAEAWTDLGLHPNIAYCYYVHPIQHVPVIAIEYLDGGDLRSWIAERRCADLRIGLDLAIQCCHGLEHAHARGLIHRDVKPENILLTADGLLKITDFGIVRRRESAGAGFAGALRQAAGASRTIGAIGTYNYMAPEQFAGPDVGLQADIFALGVCLYEMWCGRRPYEVAQGARQEAPNPRSLRGDDLLPDRLCALIQRMVEWSPGQRPASCAEVRVELCAIHESLFGERSSFAELTDLPPRAGELNNRGVSYFELGQIEGSLRSFRAALTESPLHPEATYNRSLLEQLEGRISHDQAVVRMKEARKGVMPGRAAYLEGLVHLAAWAESDARRCFELAASSDPPEVEAIIALGDVAMARGKFGVAEDAYRRAISLSTDGRPLADRLAYAAAARPFSLTANPLPWRHCLATISTADSTVAKAAFGFIQHDTHIALLPDNLTALSAGFDSKLRVWDLAGRACTRVLAGHRGPVRCIAVTPDGKVAVSRGDASDLFVWDIATGECLRTMRPAGPVHTATVVIEPLAGPTAVAAGDASGVSAAAAPAAPASALPPVTSLPVSVESAMMSISADARLALTASVQLPGIYIGGAAHEDKWALQLWDLEQCALLWEKRGEMTYGNHPRPHHTLRTDPSFHADTLTSVAMTPDGQFGLSGASDGTARLWRLPDGKGAAVWNLDEADGLASWSGHARQPADPSAKSMRIMFETPRPSQRPVHVAISSDGTVAIATIGESLFLLNLASNDFVHLGRTDRMTGTIACLALSADGRLVAVGHGASISIWDVASRKCVGVLAEVSLGIVTAMGRVVSVAFGSGSSMLLSSTADGTLRAWDVRGLSNRRPALVLARASSVRTIAQTSRRFHELMSAAQTELASGRQDEALRSITAARQLPGYEHARAALECTAILGRQLPRCGLRGVWCLSRVRSSSPVIAIALAAEHNVALWARENGQVDVVGPSGERGFVLRGHRGDVNTVAIRRDGILGLTGGKDATVRTWNLVDGRCEVVFEGHQWQVTSVALMPDGTRALSASSDGAIMLWDLARHRRLQLLAPESDYGVFAVCATPDGCSVLAAGDDGALRLWDLDSGRQVRTMRGSKQAIRAAAVSPDGTLALAGSDDALRLWDLRTGECTRVLANGAVRVVTISPDGKFGLWLSDGGVWSICRLHDGVCLHTVEADAGTMNAFVLDDDGTRVISSESDGMVSTWQLDWELEAPPEAVAR